LRNVGKFGRAPRLNVENWLDERVSSKFVGLVAKSRHRKATKACRLVADFVAELP